MSSLMTFGEPAQGGLAQVMQAGQPTLPGAHMGGGGGGASEFYGFAVAAGVFEVAVDFWDGGGEGGVELGEGAGEDGEGGAGGRVRGWEGWKEGVGGGERGGWGWGGCVVFEVFEVFDEGAAELIEGREGEVAGALVEVF